MNMSLLRRQNICNSIRMNYEDDKRLLKSVIFVKLLMLNHGSGVKMRSVLHTQDIPIQAEYFSCRAWDTSWSTIHDT